MSNQIVLQSEEKMKKIIEHLKTDFATVRTGRATPAVLNAVKVPYYGSEVPVNQVGNISVPEPRLIVITPWDKSILRELEKAILKADIGITPQNDGNVIRLPIPSLTEDRRKDIIKSIARVTETHRVFIRNERRDALETVKKMFDDKKVNEDEKFKIQGELQKLTDEYIRRVDDLYTHKEKEIMEI
ncbi:MAG: Ribosome-recycling factor [Elusimicrobia bacterium ADurb.Bin231]|nr:MAG: Ribosome-recycling factor [Elusimicrobia bacterium ADurb.Bin231]